MDTGWMLNNGCQGKTDSCLIVCVSIMRSMQRGKRPESICFGKQFVSTCKCLTTTRTYKGVLCIVAEHVWRYWCLSLDIRHHCNSSSHLVKMDSKQNTTWTVLVAFWGYNGASMVSGTWLKYPTVLLASKQAKYRVLQRTSRIKGAVYTANLSTGEDPTKFSKMLKEKLFFIRLLIHFEKVYKQIWECSWPT